MLLNFYECECGAHWRDEWDCACDDKCPVCNRAVEPYDSIEQEGLEYEAYREQMFERKANGIETISFEEWRERLKTIREISSKNIP